MARRRRRGAEPGDFEDPLKKYDPPQVENSLAASLREDTVLSLKTTPFTLMSGDTPVHQVLKDMYERNVGCVMIAEGDRLVGIFSERDVLIKVADNYQDVKDLPVRELMTQEPVSVFETDTPAKALNLMAVGSFRHIPVLDVDGRIVGIVGPTRTAAYLQKKLDALRGAAIEPST